MYAVGTEHPLREPCVHLVAAIREGRVTAATTHFVIQEFLHIRARRFSRRDAVSLARKFATLLSPLLTVDDDVADRGLELFERYRLGAFDAFLAAAALANDATALVSGDNAFADVPRLRHILPGTPEFDALIA